jgi:hypothetical protein
MGDGLNDEFTVGAAGTLSLPFAGEVEAGGTTTGELASLSRSSILWVRLTASGDTPASPPGLPRTRVKPNWCRSLCARIFMTMRPTR